jgi:hypothetical protein
MHFFYLDTNVETEDAIFFEGKRDEEVVEYDDMAIVSYICCMTYHFLGIFFVFY